MLAFLARHGHRAAREAELAEPRWREEAARIFDTVRLHLPGARSTGVALAASPDTELRSRAEGALGALPVPARLAVQALLSVVRHSMELRERLHGDVVAVLDLLRTFACDVSRRIVVREPGIGGDAAFFLTLPEIHGFLRGELRAVRPLVTMRRAGFQRDRMLPSPPSTFVDYPPPVTLRWGGELPQDGEAVRPQPPLDRHG
jgi:pyruvate,water dikinase